MLAGLDGAKQTQAVSYLTQQDSLFPWLTALDNAGLSLKLQDDKNWRDKSLAMLAPLGLADHTHKKPVALSGGMRQRVALARVLLEDRPLILMDEPFSALDAITKQQLMCLTSNRLRGKTVIWVTHDPLEALQLGHHIMVLSAAPAVLQAPIHLSGPPLRKVNDPAVLAAYETILSQLAGESI